VSTIIESIELEVPVRTAYDQWTQFEEFPLFMEGVQRVEQIDDKTLRWTARIGGVERSWEAKITEQEPDRRIAWRSTDGAMNAGVVTFQPKGEDRSEMTLQLDVEPTDTIEKVGDALGLVERQTKGDVQRFKEFIETRHQPTGAWRGEVHDGSARR
jgi:uncharacterized membrane protein